MAKVHTVIARRTSPVHRRSACGAPGGHRCPLIASITPSGARSVDISAVPFPNAPGTVAASPLIDIWARSRQPNAAFAARGICAAAPRFGCRFFSPRAKQRRSCTCMWRENRAKIAGKRLEGGVRRAPIGAPRSPKTLPLPPPFPLLLFLFSFRYPSFLDAQCLIQQKSGRETVGEADRRAGKLSGCQGRRASSESPSPLSRASFAPNPRHSPRTP